MNYVHSILQIFKSSEFKSKLYHLKELKTSTPKNAALVYWLFWAEDTWKSTDLLFLLPKDRSSKRNSCHQSPYLDFHQPGNTVVTKEKTRSRHHNHILSQIIFPIYSCKGSFIFHKIIYSSLSGLPSSSPLLPL